ncbi:MAG: NAD(P)-binding domain-containing protein [Chitinophagaceae bacterium]|nr:NAD(P)-binding domain-containing protein [Chitinophagaceae bacterium]
MNIGIVGTGLVGGTLARQLARAGHKVFISFSKTPGKLKAIVDEMGVNVVETTPEEAVSFSEVIILSVHFLSMNDAIRQMGDTKGKILIDTSNQYDIKLPAGVTAASEVIKRLPEIKLVKAFNTHRYSDLLLKAFHDPLFIMPYSGDNAEAIGKTAAIINSIGFEAFYVGTLKEVYKQEMHGVLYGKNITSAEAIELLNQ